MGRGSCIRTVCDCMGVCIDCKSDLYGGYVDLRSFEDSGEAVLEASFYDLRGF